MRGVVIWLEPRWAVAVALLSSSPGSSAIVRDGPGGADAGRGNAGGPRDADSAGGSAALGSDRSGSGLLTVDDDADDEKYAGVEPRRGLAGRLVVRPDGGENMGDEAYAAVVDGGCGRE